jgi:hypothetical protein
MLYETSDASHSLTQRHVPDERTSQLNRFASLKIRFFCSSNPLIGTFCKIKEYLHFARVVLYMFRSIMAITCHCFHIQPEPAGLCNGDTLSCEAETEFAFIMKQNFGIELVCLKGLQEQKMDLRSRSTRPVIYS